jgi:predicted kinase
MESKEKFRKQAQLLAEKINENVYDQRKHLIGKILTIVDASFSDPEQRKAVKDMVNDAFYGPSYWHHISEWIEGFVRANGIDKLYEHETLSAPTMDKNDTTHIFESIK